MIAGYQGSPDAALTAKVTEDLEFGAAIASLERNAVTYILWKVQSADAPKDQPAAVTCIEGEEDQYEVQACSESESEVTIVRDVARPESSDACTGESAKASEDYECDTLQRIGQKRQRIRSLDEDDFDSD